MLEWTPPVWSHPMGTVPYKKVCNHSSKKKRVEKKKNICISLYMHRIFLEWSLEIRTFVASIFDGLWMAGGRWLEGLFSILVLFEFSAMWIYHLFKNFFNFNPLSRLILSYYVTKIHCSLSNLTLPFNIFNKLPFQSQSRQVSVLVCLRY